MRRVVHTNGIAQGVAASLTIDGETRRLFVKAKRVVVSCGSINSPALLLRSKLKNPNIGKNLYLHPVTMAFGLFPDTCVKQYNGSIMTAVSPIVQNVHGNGYGALIEVPIFTPGFAGAFSPWKGRVEHKFDMLKYNNKMALIVLTRDKDPGRVWIDKDGNPRVGK